MNKPVLVVTTRHVKEVEERIDLNYDARRNPNEAPFGRQALVATSDGADALFITPVADSIGYDPSACRLSIWIHRSARRCSRKSRSVERR